MKQEELYWDKRYRYGGESGAGSVGAYRKWKWSIIDKYVKVKEKTVLDVGCGDITFLKGKRFKGYLGLDISPTIIKRNQKKRPDLLFDTVDVTQIRFIVPQFEVLLCMDLLFHIMDDDDFEDLLGNLNHLAGEWLFLINWCKNPLLYLKDDHQYFRDLTLWFDRLPDLELVATHQKKGDPYNMLYVFRRGA